MPATILTEAICLRGYDYSESSRALHFYSPQVGLIRAAAKGMRRAGSPLSGVGEKLAVSQLHLRAGGSMYVIAQYQTLESFALLRTDLLALAAASALAETTHRLGGENDAEAALIYAAVRDALYALQALAARPNVIALSAGEATSVLAEALLRLLAVSGYAPTLDCCVISGEPLMAHAPFHPFSPELGGVLGPTAARAAEARHRVNVSSQTLIALRDPARADWQQADPARALGFLRYYLAYRLERPIRAFDFLLSVISQSPASGDPKPSAPPAVLERSPSQPLMME